MAGQPPEPRSTAKGVYHLFLGNVTASSLMALGSIVVARLLGPGEYGLYALALVTPGYVLSLIQLAVPSAAVRFTAKYESEGDHGRAVSFLYSLTSFQVLLALASVALVLPLSSFIAERVLNRPELASLIPLASTVVVGVVIYNTVTAGFQGMNMMKRSASLQVLQGAVKVAASIGLLLLGYAVMGATVGYVIGYLVAGAIGLLLVVKMNGHVIPKGLAKDVAVAMRYSAPLVIAGLVGGIVGPYQTTLLANSVPNSAIGGYGASVNLATLVSLFVYPISTVLFPLFSGLADDREKLAGAYQTTVKYSTLFVVPITSLIMALSVPIASAVYGRAWQFSGIYLLGVVFPYLFVGFGSLAQGALLNGMGETRKAMTAGLASSAVVAISATFLIRYYGVYGAIASSILGQIVGLVVAWRMISGLLGQNVRLSGVWRVYLASGLGAALTYPVSFLPLHPILVTLIGGVLFLLVLVPLLVWTRAATREDVSALESYFSTLGPASFLFRQVASYYDFFDRRKSGGTQAGKARRTVHS